MGTQVMDLTAFKGKGPAQAFAALNPVDDGLADGIGSSYGVIGYKGKTWTLRYQGQKYPFTRPDDNSPINYIDVIILRSAHQKSKSYYAAYDPNASEGARPICASLDGINPDNDVQQKQATACALCPRNEWRTNAAGRRERECTDYKRMAVLLLPTQTQRMLGQALMEPVFLRVPAGSLENLKNMSDQMKAQGFHSATYITRVSFDPNEAHPLMIFTPLQPLSDAEAPVVLPLVNDDQAKRIIGEDVMAAQRHSVAITAQPAVSTGLITGPAPAAQPVVVQPVVVQPVVVQPQPQPQPQPVVVQPVVAPPPSTVDTGLMAVAGPNPTVMAQPAAVAPTTQTVADTGAPEESDAALDERIASLLGTKAV